MANHDLVSSRDGRNVRGPERWASLAGGLGLLALASRRGRPVPRLLMTLAGVMLAGRGLTGHCAVKAAMEPSAPRPGAGAAPERSAALPKEREPWSSGDILDEPGDLIEEASKQSFPASDPPAYIIRGGYS